MTGEGHPATGYQTAEKTAHPAITLRFVESRPHIPGMAAEAQGHTPIVCRGNIQGTARQDGKTEPGGIENFNQIRTPFISFHQFGPGGLKPVGSYLRPFPVAAFYCSRIQKDVASFILPSLYWGRSVRIHSISEGQW